NRYYEPPTGRFATTDPLMYYAAYNLYLGLQSTPTMFADPLGMASEVTDDAGRTCCDDELLPVFLFTNRGHAWLGIPTGTAETEDGQKHLLLTPIGFWPNPEVRRPGGPLEAIFGTAGGVFPEINYDSDGNPAPLEYTEAMLYQACPETVAALVDDINKDIASPPRWSGANHCGSWATDKLAAAGFTTFTTWDSPDQISDQIQDVIKHGGGAAGTSNVAVNGPGVDAVISSYSVDTRNTSAGSGAQSSGIVSGTSQSSAARTSQSSQSSSPRSSF
ncbi:MAG TPA: hypothetical protein PLP01_08695, partial [Phycisphaerae bacterium]|nr:hypothetical protein [Phycisphaerae bacterium]